MTRYDPATDGAAAENIVRCLARATPDDYSTGLEWYSVARDVACGIGQGNHVTGAGILAALSPQISWERCQTLARVNTTGKRFKRRGHFKACLAKAAAVFSSGDPWSVLRGLKERAFACNIAYGVQCPHGGTKGLCVTIDRHVLAIAYGRVLSQSEVKLYLDRVGVYESIAGYYRQVAEAADLSPHIVQAITWVTWRREKKLL